jgi:hypothetical protein
MFFILEKEIIGNKNITYIYGLYYIQLKMITLDNIGKTNIRQSGRDGNLTLLSSSEYK